ncbi:MAG: DUF962 domain-containing protein [Acidobacteria bacterium]|nr:DUF962 domain-containing protein [Acidobacteriota bacterium]MCB9398196.1 DUF962 domain-containing protein [Acidobacteriota bacterium]
MTAQQLLSDYGAYHRDARNKMTHYFGIPMIVFAIQVMLRAVHIPVSGLALDGALVVLIPVALYYLFLAPGLGLVMAVLLAIGYVLAGPLGVWVGVGLFLLGWVLQFIGHFYEGKKPAFLKNALHLLAGPLFILNQLFLKLGMPGGLKVS